MTNTNIDIAPLGFIKIATFGALFSAGILLSGCVVSPPKTVATNEASKPQTVAASEASPATQQDASTEDKTDKDRMVCRRTIVTGSRFAKRVCRKWSEWQAIEQNGRNLVEGNQRAATFTTPDGGGR